MNDYHSSANDAFSPQQERDRSGSTSFGNLPVSPPGPPSDHGGAAVDDAGSKDQNLDGDNASPTQASGPSGANSEQLKQVQDVLSSEVRSTYYKQQYTRILSYLLTAIYRLASIRF
jgi:hypothetical protein